MKKINLSFNAGEIVEDKLYFSANQFNGLYMYDFSTKKCDFICEFINESWETYYLHSKCIKYKNLLIFMPGVGSYINIYDIGNGSQNSVRIKENQITQDNYGGAVIYRDELWLFSKYKSLPTIVLNLKNYNIRNEHTINKWCDENLEGEEMILCTRIVNDSNWIWMAPYGSNKVIKFNMDNNTIITFDVEDSKLFGVFDGGTHLWVSEKIGSCIYSIDKKCGNVEKFMVNDDCELDNGYISQIIDVRGGVYILPSHKKTILQLNEREKLFDNPIAYPEEVRCQNSAFLNFCINKGDIYFFPLKSDGILKYNYEKKEIEFYPTYIECSEIMAEKLLIRRMKADKYVVENEIYKLDTFIKYLKR